MDGFVMLGAGALLVRLGHALYAIGLTRSKNAAGVATRSLFDLCIAALAFWAVGAAILFQQHNGWLGIRSSMLCGWNVSPQAAGIVFFYLSAVLIATGALTGTFAERSRFFPASAAAILVAGIVVPIVGKWAWTGWLHDLGFIDMAGASVFHLAGGVCAAVGAWLMGARTGKYNRDGSTSMIPGHNVPLAIAGSLLTLSGWTPYVLGFALLHNAPLGVAALNVLLAGAGGGAAAVLLGRLRYGKPDVTLALLGFLGALVAITACAGRVGAPASVAIGIVAGVIVPLASIVLDLIVRIDDPTGGICVHAAGGVWGTLAAGVFLPGSSVARLQQVGIQLLGAAAIAVFAAAVAGTAFYAIKSTIGLRAREADEFDGLDLAEHDIGAYPDFQQTMIKSYHLREA